MMPSASTNTKLEKQVSGAPAESTDNNHATNPMKQTLITIEHKIRNLEKRKTKLETYRAIQASGKELSADQKAAVAKYDAVAQTLEFARDFFKQMVQFSKDAEKEQKKQARKDAIVKAQTETSKIREVLIIQNILTNLSSGEIREAFLSGENGAIKLETVDMENLEKLVLSEFRRNVVMTIGDFDRETDEVDSKFGALRNAGFAVSNLDIQTKRPEQTDDVPFLTLAQKAAEYLSMTIDGRPKQYGETTFENMKRIFQQIQECGYLDKVHCVAPPFDNVEEVSAVPEELSACDQQEEDLETSDEAELEEAIVDDMSQPLEQPHQQQLAKATPTYDANAPNVNNVYVVESTEINPVYATQLLQHNQVPQQQTSPPPQQPSGIVTNQQSPPQQQQQQQPQPQPIPHQVVHSPVSMQQAPVAGMPQTIAAVAAPVPGHFSATTVRAVEEAYFKQQQYLQQMRPLAEVIGGGNFFFLQDSELDSPDMGAATYNNPNEVQTQCTNNFQQHQSQQPPPPQQQQQQQQHQIQLVQSTVVQQQPAPSTQPHQQQQQQQLPKGAHVNLSAPIPTQTFTNQSFPPIVQAPAALYPVTPNSVATSLQSPLNCVPADKQQMAQAVFSPAVNTSPAILSVQHQIIAAANHQPQIEQQQQTATVVMMNRVPIAGFQQYDAGPVAATVQVLSQAPIIQQQADPYIEQIEVSKDDAVVTEDINTSPTSEWESNDREDRRRDDSQTKPETNQWSSEMNSAALFNSNSGGGAGENQSDSSSNANSNSRKNDWNEESQHQARHESNHWSSSSHQNDSYGGGRSRHNYNRNDQRTRDGGRSNNGMDRGGMRGGNGGGSMGSGGYRGRNSYTSSQSQQNGGGRGGNVYFRNNDNSYYHNSQNGNSNNGGGGGGGGNNGSGGYSKESGNGQRYDNTNNYRSRGGNNNATNNNRNNSNPTTNGNNTTRSSISSMSGSGGGGGGGGMNGQRSGGGRTSGGGSSGSTYVNSRQQTNARQTQDVA